MCALNVDKIREDFPILDRKINDKPLVYLENDASSHLLDAEGITARDGRHCAIPLTTSLNITSSLRASFYLYNIKTEIDTFIEAPKKTIGSLK